jgi:hypothetical protein
MICTLNVNRVISILRDYNDIVGIGSKTETPILFVSRVQEVDVEQAAYKFFYPRLLSALSSDVHFDIWIRQQGLAARSPRREFQNSLVTRIWFNAQHVFAPEVKILMERGDFDMNYIRSINYPHEFKDVHK